jgi:hypothetical protein
MPSAYKSLGSIDEARLFDLTYSPKWDAYECCRCSKQFVRFVFVHFIDKYHLFVHDPNCIYVGASIFLGFV